MFEAQDRSNWRSAVATVPYRRVVCAHANAAGKRERAQRGGHVSHDLNENW